MKKLQKIIGMSHNEIAHSVPLSSIPELQEKQPKSQTLFEKCLKAMIKQRMSGHLVNKKRKQRYYETENPQSSHLKSISLNHEKKMKQLIVSSRYQTPRKSLQLRTNVKEFNLPKQKSREHISFISAIEEQTYDKNQSIQSKLIQSVLKDKKERVSEFNLPQIKKRKNSMNAVSKKGPSKNLFKNPEDNVNIDFWLMICGKNKKQKQKKRKNSLKQEQNISATKSSILKKPKEIASKEQLQLYLSQLPNGIKKLLDYLMAFFQVKLPSQLTLMNYGKLLEDLKNVKGRGWSFFIYSFWDANKDGLITSEDIFHHFKQFQLDQSENSFQGSALIKQACDIFLNQMKKLNSLFPTESYEERILNEQQNEQIKYLEEVLLTKRGIKYKDMGNIFSSGEQNSSAQIDLFPKDLTVKCSSSYRQCFIATEHNEQTRLSREEIENFKADLRKIKHRRNQKIKQQQIQEKRSTKYLTYEYFVDNGLGKQIRNIIYLILGIN